MRYLLAAGLLGALFLQSCQGVDSGVSRVKSGYTSADCTSLKKQFDLQTQKLPSLIRQFEQAYAESQKSQASDGGAPAKTAVSGSWDLNLAQASSRMLTAPSSPVLAEGKITSIQDCAQFPISGSDLYGACKEVFLVVKAATDAANEYNDTSRPDSCIEGSGQNVVSQLFSYCDNQCSFGDADCTACSFTFQNGLGVSETARMICATKTSVVEAINAFCQQSGSERCPIQSCNTASGRFFATGGAGEGSGNVVSGSNATTEAVDLSQYAGAYVSVDVSAGVKTQVDATVKGRVNGTIKIVSANSNQQVYEQSGVYSAGTSVRCSVEITALSDLEINAKVGVEGSLKLFGNGVSAGAGVTRGGAIRLSRTLTKVSSPIPAAGQTARLIYGQCADYIKTWVVNDLVTHIRNNEAFRVVKEVVDVTNQQIGTDPLVQPVKARAESAATSVYRRLGWVGYYKACSRESYFGAWSGGSQEGDDACRADSRNESASNQQFFYQTCSERLDKICKGEVSP